MKSDIYRYNWFSIKYHTKNDIEKILLYFNKVYIDNSDLRLYLLANTYARNIIEESKNTHMQYILNLKALLENNLNATKQEIFVYLDLVSMRDYFSYINTKGKLNYLPAWKVIDKYDIKQLETNRLLFIEDKKIYFVYEGEN